MYTYTHICMYICNLNRMSRQCYFSKTWVIKLKSQCKAQTTSL